MGATVRASVGLSVKPSIQWVLVLCMALRTHLKSLHRGVRAIVGKRSQDAEARAAVGTVGEGIAIATVGRIVNFVQTGWTGGEIGQNQCRFRSSAQRISRI